MSCSIILNGLLRLIRSITRYKRTDNKNKLLATDEKQVGAAGVCVFEDVSAEMSFCRFQLVVQRAGTAMISSNALIEEEEEY